MVNINIKIPDELHKKMKLYCVLEDVSIKEFIVNSLKKNITKSNLNKKRGK